jgi:hypothetical protein
LELNVNQAEELEDLQNVGLDHPSKNDLHLAIIYKRGLKYGEK